jgi:hypothetical protein
MTRPIDRRTLELGAYRLLRRAGERVGLQVVRKSFYSPIPDLQALPPDLWARRSALRGIRFDLDAQLAWIERELAGAVREFAPSEAPTGRRGEYTLANDSYGRVGADILHGVVRGLRPRLIVELGSGWSTLVMASAAARNRAEGARTELRTFDPFPRLVPPDLPGLASLERVSAQDVPLEVFTSLTAGDVLFVDTTHTVKLGSDVNRIVLDILPALAPGVLVHLHDIFLPYEYPRRWAEESGLYWTEQYLLQAFLVCNPTFDVLAAVHALCRDRPAAMERLAPTWRPGASASAFWMRRV